ncbi:transposase domain-containing protein [Burkholderia gladioli]
MVRTQVESSYAVQSAKANGIDPYRFLTWLCQRLPLAKSAEDYDRLLPGKMPAELRCLI